MQWEGPIGNAHRKAVVPGDAPDLLDDVLGDGDVRANRRGRRDERVAIRRGDELEPAEDIERLLRSDLDAEHARDVGEAHAHVDRPPAFGVAVHHAAYLGPGVLAEEADGARERDRDEIGRELPRKAARRGAPCRAMQPELRRRAAYPARFERRTFERDRRGVLADLRIFAAEDAGNAERAVRVRDHERSLWKDPVDAVERSQRLAAPRLPRHKDTPV